MIQIIWWVYRYLCWKRKTFRQITYQILLIIWFHFLTFLKWHLIKMENSYSSQRLKKRAMRKLSMAIKRYRSDSCGWMCSVFWLWWYYMNLCIWLEWHRAKDTHTHTHTHKHTHTHIGVYMKLVKFNQGQRNISVSIFWVWHCTMTMEEVAIRLLSKR